MTGEINLTVYCAIVIDRCDSIEYADSTNGQLRIVGHRHAYNASSRIIDNRGLDVARSNFADATSISNIIDIVVSQTNIAINESGIVEIDSCSALYKKCSKCISGLINSSRWIYVYRDSSRRGETWSYIYGLAASIRVNIRVVSNIESKSGSPSLEGLIRIILVRPTVNNSSARAAGRRE
ncbi:hypothetical protein [Methylobacterium longum]|uniref:Uncharacterized protein n=1 Tax=Methylobacterium longum TaxID=767694 RepID=A0ABT8AMV0_9HYPH|nr:hypothetical protein [Methylobacterium longum]MDN3571128.1 hypothetical protein [Methylobacterium longum]